MQHWKYKRVANAYSDVTFAFNMNEWDLISHYKVNNSNINRQYNVYKKLNACKIDNAVYVFFFFKY